MAKPLYWGQTLTAIGLVAALAGCAGSLSPNRSTLNARQDPSKIGLATRAQAALGANDLASALDLAERAVEYRPQDAVFRALLGNVYLASGRFASAEATYRDSLSISANQPQVVLKLALVQIALGRSGEASALLASAQRLLDPTDLGLALALAGRADQAVSVLEPAARAVGADARTRQNLALAYALGGDWDMARTIAAQDLAADQLDVRIDQWMALSKPGQSGAQVAAFIGVVPVAVDPGQPVRLALNPGAAAPTRVAVVTLPPAQVAEVAAPYIAPEPIAEPVAELAPVAPQVEMATPIVAEPAPQQAAILRAPRPALSPAAVKLSQSLPELRRAALPRATGRSRAVLQLGAYASREFIPGAWNKVAARHASLKNYTPVIARFDSARGTVYRLSVKGFASERQAITLCSSLKRAGANCFVRATFNDAPVRMAMR